MLNLTENMKESICIEPSKQKIKSDKFSALEYGLYYIKQLEDDGGRKKEEILKTSYSSHLEIKEVSNGEPRRNKNKRST